MFSRSVGEAGFAALDRLGAALVITRTSPAAAPVNRVVKTAITFEPAQFTLKHRAIMLVISGLVTNTLGFNFLAGVMFVSAWTGITAARTDIGKLALATAGRNGIALVGILGLGFLFLDALAASLGVGDRKCSAPGIFRAAPAFTPVAWIEKRAIGTQRHVPVQLFGTGVFLGCLGNTGLG